MWIFSDQNRPPKRNLRLGLVKVVGKNEVFSPHVGWYVDLPGSRRTVKNRQLNKQKFIAVLPWTSELSFWHICLNGKRFGYPIGLTPPKTNMTMEKNTHEWRWISYGTWWFSCAMLVFGDAKPSVLLISTTLRLTGWWQERCQPKPPPSLLDLHKTASYCEHVVIFMLWWWNQWNPMLLLLLLLLLLLSLLLLLLFLFLLNNNHNPFSSESRTSSAKALLMVMGFPGAKILEIALPKNGWKTILSFWGNLGLYLRGVCCWFWQVFLSNSPIKKVQHLS